MDQAITINSMLAALGTIAIIAGGIAGLVALYKYVTGAHDRAQKWDGADDQIKQLKQETEEQMEKITKDFGDKLQEQNSELCMHTYVLYALLDGLLQQGCNGEVKKAHDKMQKFMNQAAHGEKEE